LLTKKTFSFLHEPRFAKKIRLKKMAKKIDRPTFQFPAPIGSAKIVEMISVTRLCERLPFGKNLSETYF
jgi:hypothetical protein